MFYKDLSHVRSQVREHISESAMESSGTKLNQEGPEDTENPPPIVN